MRITARQRTIYGYLRGTILARGVPPTVREIGDRFGIRSPNGVLCHLRALEKKGLICRDASQARGIRLELRPSDRLRLPFAGRIG